MLGEMEMTRPEDSPRPRIQEVFDGFEAQVATNRAQFYHDLPAGPFYGFNRSGAMVYEGVIQNW